MEATISDAAGNPDNESVGVPDSFNQMLYECCDCGAMFEDPDTDKHPDEDCCPVCGFDEIREVDCPVKLAEYFGDTPQNQPPVTP